MRRSLRALTAAALTLAGLLIATGTGAAGACGSDWWPANGTQTIQWTGNDLILRTTFSFADQNIKSFKCNESSAFEVDHLLYKGIAPAKGTLTTDSNLPDWYNDTEFDDKYPPRTLSIGSQSADKLRAGTEYFVKIRVSGAGINDNKIEQYLNFQRSHWAKKWGNPKQVAEEQASCQGHGGSDPAWCVFASATQRMADVGVGPFVVDSNPQGVFGVLSWGAGSSAPTVPEF